MSPATPSALSDSWLGRSGQAWKMTLTRLFTWVGISVMMLVYASPRRVIPLGMFFGWILLATALVLPTLSAAQSADFDQALVAPRALSQGSGGTGGFCGSKPVPFASTMGARRSRADNSGSRAGLSPRSRTGPPPGWPWGSRLFSRCSPLYSWEAKSTIRPDTECPGRPTGT